MTMVPSCAMVSICKAPFLPALEMVTFTRAGKEGSCSSSPSGDSSSASSSRSAGAMESSGATLILPPLVRPVLMAPLDWAPPDCPSDGRPVESGSSAPSSSYRARSSYLSASWSRLFRSAMEKTMRMLEEVVNDGCER